MLQDTTADNINPDDPNEINNNDYKARAITLLLTPPPDLIVAAVTPQAVGFGGELFTVEWTGQVLDQGRPYWDAPIFYPHAGTFAWSETQPFTSVVVWSLSKLVGIILAYNLVLLLYLTLAGLAAYSLARQLTQDRVAHWPA